VQYLFLTLNKDAHIQTGKSVAIKIKWPDSHTVCDFFTKNS